ncbi:MAG: DEAD/DEAH box helicase [Phycisphaerae bacterium]|nr:DEAD/DEAH box helicase [Phycisphaerae bacterium]
MEKKPAPAAKAASAKKPAASKAARKPAAADTKPQKAPVVAAIAEAEPVLQAHPEELVTPLKPGLGFDELGLHPDILAALRDAKFETPSDIQRELIPHALKGQDCLGQARTGTGKTAAFAIPLLQLVKHRAGLQALVLVPTRELAVQVDQHVRMLGKQRGLSTALAYGGANAGAQIRQIADGAEIVVGTPGRVLDLHGRRALPFDGLKHVVLDEVDRMLDIGFRDDIRRILRSIKSKHQTIFVSATISDEIRKLAKTYMHEPVEINVSADELTVDKIEQGYVTVERRDKFDTLLKFMRAAKPTLAIVFCNMKVTARKVAKLLKENRIECVEIHGDLMQRKRERAMEQFRKAHVQVLVATDLASRGLDVLEVSHIVNYDIPEDTAVYVHRIGRTARMGKSGYAVTFVQPDEGKQLTDIENLINRVLPQFEDSWAPPRVARPVAAPPPAPTPESHAEITIAGEKEHVQLPKRLLEPYQRDVVLDSYGLVPLARNLGSRFRSNRRRR